MDKKENPAVEHDLEDIVFRFDVQGSFSGADPMGQGHINDTYLVRMTHGMVRCFTLQRINHHVFRQPELMMSNFEKITSHLRRKLVSIPGRNPERETLNLIRTRSGGNHYLSSDGNYWRAYHYIGNSHTIDVARNPDQAFQAGCAFGRFQKLLDDLPAGELYETIPFFHHTPRRFARFKDALDADRKGRSAGSADAVSFALAREAMAPVVTDALADGSLPLRSTHNDTKINNVLFDDDSGQAVCVIDLDTTMPGSALYDFGDMVRTTTCLAAEDERNLSKVKVDMGMFTALARGYLGEARDSLSDKEIDLLVFAGRLITFTIGLRFLTDHLEGDVYFKIHRPGHNLDRARAQFALVKSIEDQERQMTDVVRSLVERA